MTQSTVHLGKTAARIDHGNATARFVKTKQGWTPDWFTLDKRRMLRFKDHEWMSVSNKRAPMTRVKKVGDTGLRFEGQMDFYGVRVEAWVQVEAAPDGPGFLVTSEFRPTTGMIEIFEAGCAFECPYEYDLREDSTTFLGGNPVYKHRDGEVVSGLYLENVDWVANRKLRARQSYVCWTPLLLHRVRDLDGGNERCISVLGHWDDCTFREVYATPTRGGGNVANDGPQFLEAEKRMHENGEKRGYKYLMGCTNWSSSLVKDPNFFIKKNQPVRQKVTVSFTHDLDGHTLDEWAIVAWERVAAYTFPTNGRPKVYQVAAGQNVTWERAASELTGMFKKKKYGNVWDEKGGIQIYLDGSRPTSYGFNNEFAMQWYGPSYYWGVLRGDHGLQKKILAHAERHGQSMVEKGAEAFELAHMFFSFAPIMRLLGQAETPPASLRQLVSDYVRLNLPKITGKEDYLRLDADFGTLSFFASSLLIAARALDIPEAGEKARLLLKQINAQLEENGEFWRFGCGAWHGWCQAGKQIRAAGPAQAAMANLLAYYDDGDESRIACATKFINYTIGLSVNTWNASPVDDMDTRGFAMGGNAGRDQKADLPPWETFECIRTVCAMLDVVEDAPAAWYDAIFMAARSGLCSMPAARTRKRAFTTEGTAVYEPVAKNANLVEIYSRGEWIAYENPWDQTMQAPYQGVEPIMNHLVFGGGIAHLEDDRVIAIVPEAASYRQQPGEPVKVVVWNPTNKTIRTDLTLHSGTRKHTRPIRVPGRTALRLGSDEG